MQDLISVFDFMATVIGLFLATMLSHWYTTIILFLLVLGAVVALYLSIRGA